MKYNELIVKYVITAALLASILFAVPGIAAAAKGNINGKEFLFDKKLSTQPIPKDLGQLEKTYVAAYQDFLDASVKLKRIIANQKPGNRKYSAADLKDFNEKMDALYAKYPNYKYKVVKKEEAQDVAYFTGLPMVELCRYQAAKGTYGLKTITDGVINIPNKKWLDLYLRLIDVAPKGSDYIDKTPATQANSPVEKALMNYRIKGARFHILAETVFVEIDKALRKEINHGKKCRLSVKQTVYLFMAKRAGRGDEWGVKAAEFPVKEARKDQYPGAAMLSERLNIPFDEIVYVRVKRGTYAMKHMVETWTWLPNHKEILKKLIELS